MCRDDICKIPGLAPRALALGRDSKTVPIATSLAVSSVAAGSADAVLDGYKDSHKDSHNSRANLYAKMKDR